MMSVCPSGRLSVRPPVCLSTFWLTSALKFVFGLGQISSFFSYYQHLFPAAVWSIVTRFPASGCFKCHYYLIRVLTLFCARFFYTTESLPRFYRIIKYGYNFLDCSVGVWVFVTGLGQISSFFSYVYEYRLDTKHVYRA